MNEELQSANEELETSKEELQSLNEELSTVNSQLQDKLEELESANNDMANLLHSTDIPTVFLGPDRTIKRFTPAATQLFNLIATDVGRPVGDISSRFTDLEFPDDVDAVLHKLTAREKEVGCADGRWYMRRITPYRTLDNRIEGVVLTFTDITPLKQAEQELRLLTGELEQRVAQCTQGFEAETRERRRAEEQLRLRQAELAHLHRLYTAGEMAAAFAHELNQPLAAIASYSDAGLIKLQRGEIDRDQLAGSLELIAAQAQRAGRIIRELLTFLSKTETFKTSVDVNALVHSAVELMQPEAMTHGISIRHHLSEGMRTVLAEAIHIEHVLVNLLRNAIDAIRDAALKGGVVTVETDVTDQGMVRISVHDTGPGIDARAVEQLFKPFHTTKPQGLGMGLAISSSIVEAHGGRIWAEPGNGGVFRFTLPYAP